MPGCARTYPTDGRPGMIWELALLLPPVARFFAGLFLVLVIAGGSAVFILWIYTHYGEDEEIEE